jgi:enoyl-CoA hydratase/carnithine racemase
VTDAITQAPADVLLYEVRDGVAWLTFNRPQVMNAFNPTCYRAILDAIAAAVADDGVFALVFTGAGGRAFSTGGDLKDMAQREAAGDHALIEPGLGEAVFRAVGGCRKPTIAAVDGHCLAGGMEVATLCDIRIATEKSSFGLPEVRRSLMPEPGLVELPRMIPLGEALKLILTGRPMTARRAYEIGFIQAVAEDRAAMMAEAVQIAGDIALGAPLAVEAYKQVVREGRSMSPEQAGLYRMVHWNAIQRSEDRFEGPRAFAEKRAPVWRRK